MIIRKLRVDRFGAWRDLELGPLDDGLHVFYGPNEAGKTTLLHFLRAMLFGFSTERRERYGASVGPEGEEREVGGSLELELDGDTLRLARHDHEPHEAGAQGRLLLTTELGDSRSALDWARLRGPLDEETYTRVFAIGLHELQELGVLNDAQSSRWLFDMSAGLEHVGLPEVLGELRHASARLWGGTDRPGLLPRLLAERENLVQSIHDLHGQTTEYLRLAARREELQDQIERLEDERGGWTRRLRTAESAEHLHERWLRRRAAENELRMLGQLPAFPVDGLARLDELNARIRKRRRDLQVWRRRHGKARQRLKGLALNRPLVDNAARILALVEQQPRMRELAAQLAGVRRDPPAPPPSPAVPPPHAKGLKSPPAALPAWHTRLGHLTPETMKRLRSAAKALRRASQAAREADEAHAAAQAELAAAGGQARSEEHEGETLDEQIARLGELASRLRKRAQLEDRYDQLGKQRKELREYSRELLERQLLPPVLLWGLGAAVAASGAMILGGWLLRSWFFGFLGVAGLIISAGVKVWVDQQARQESQDCADQLENVEQELASAGNQREALDQQLPAGQGPWAVRLQAAERELAAVEGQLPLRARQSAQRAQLDVTVSAAEKALRERKARRQQWKQALQRAGLPEDFRPGALAELRRAWLEHRAEAERAARGKADQATREQEYRGFADRVAKLASDVGLAAAPADPLEKLARLAADLAATEAARLDWRKRKKRVALATRRRRKAARGVASAKTRRRALLAGAGTQDEAQFRRLAAQHAQAEGLRRELTALREELSDAAGGELEAVLAALDASPDRRQIVAERDQLAERERDLSERVQSLAEERGRVGQQMERLAADRSLPLARVELAALDRRINQAAENYRVQSLTARLIEQVRDRYEQERQPVVLQMASAWFKQLTGDRYARVWTPLGERVLRVDAADGQTLLVEALSRGTREQLFLALRLALIERLAQAGTRLPVVLDDVLVNYDETRSRAAAEVLRDFAEQGHQLLLFTCHEHMARLFKSLKVAVTRLPRRGHDEPAETTNLGRVKRRAPRAPLPVEPLPEPKAVPLVAEPALPLPIEVPVEVAVSETANGFVELVLAPAEPVPPFVEVEEAPQLVAAPELEPAAAAAEDPRILFGASPWIEDSEA
ncbi:MAG: AAA family ATPase [Pirellulales bacterium]